MLTALVVLGAPVGIGFMKTSFEIRQSAYDAFAARKVTLQHVASLYPIEGSEFFLRRFVHLSVLGYVDEPLRHYETLVPTTVGDSQSEADSIQK